MSGMRFRVSALGPDSIVAVIPKSCLDLCAALDLAALSDGNLSPRGMERLACHVVQCPSCQVVLAAVVRDTHTVDSTTKRLLSIKCSFEAWAAE